MGTDNRQGTYGSAVGKTLSPLFIGPPPADKAVTQICLLPAQLICAKNPALVTTVLGSCVSVTMLCRRLASWSVCHAVLANGIEEDPPGTCRYVDNSIRRMAGWFDRLGARRNEIEVKVFGGAEIMMERERTARYMSVGCSNIQTAISTIESEKLRILASDVGGNTGRKLYFSSRSGEVIIKRLRGTSG